MKAKTTRPRPAYSVLKKELRQEREVLARYTRHMWNLRARLLRKVNQVNQSQARLAAIKAQLRHTGVTLRNDPAEDQPTPVTLATILDLKDSHDAL